MKRETRYLFVIVSLGIGLASALLWILGYAPATTRAQSSMSTIHVATTGSNMPGCGSAANPCLTIQYAVDKAVDGDEIQVAAGTYTGVSTRPSPYPGPVQISQMVYISKTLTVRGGYTTTNNFAGPPDPVKNPTTLDAQGQGRVFVLFGLIQPTIEGFRITGGDATGQGGAPDGSDAAGGIGIILAQATIRYCDIFSNTAQFAGGVGMGNSAATLSWNTIRENSAHSGGEGGGVGLSASPATLIGNTIISNTAEGDGGGLVSTASDGVTLVGNQFISNTTTAGGGGLYMDTTTATLTSNIIFANRALNPGSGEGGAGIFLWNSNVIMSGTTVVSNTADLDGGGLYVGGVPEDGLPGGQVTLQNCVVADNQAGQNGSGLYIERSAAVLKHVTLARNVGPGFNDSGIYLTRYTGGICTAALTNTILVSHTVGIMVGTDCTATLESTLWATGTVWANGTPWENDGSLTHNNDFSGDPDFSDPAGHDYHIDTGSAAIDKGQDAGVEIDIDNEPRPAGAGYDLGADEYFYPVINVTKEVWPDQVQPGSQLTYTIHVVNDGNVALHATITDTLPPHVTPGGNLVWTPVIPISSTWQETVVVTVAADYYGVLTNTVEVTTTEGVAGTDTVASVSCTPLTGVDFTWEPMPALKGQPTLFTAWVTPSIPADFTWDLGESVLLSGNPISYTFPVSDTYSVDVIAADACGGSVNATRIVPVIQRFELYLPIVLR